MSDNPLGQSGGFSRVRIYSFILNVIVFAYIVTEWGDDMYRWLQGKFSM